MQTPSRPWFPLLLSWRRIWVNYEPPLFSQSLCQVWRDRTCDIQPSWPNKFTLEKMKNIIILRDTTGKPVRVGKIVPLARSSSQSQRKIWFTLPAPNIYLSSPNGPWASIHLGVHKANATIKPHKMASSSSSCPTRLRVAWKYAELTPITMNKAQIMFTPEQTCLEYGRNRYLQQEEVHL